MEFLKQFDENNEIYNEVRALEASKWWKLYMDWVKQELKTTEELILSIDENNNQVKYTWYDLLRSERAYLKAIISFTEREKNKVKPIL